MQLPVTNTSNPNTSTTGSPPVKSADFSGLRWLTSLLIVVAIALPCAVIFRAAAPSMAFLLSIHGDPRPHYSMDLSTAPSETTVAASVAIKPKTDQLSSSVPLTFGALESEDVRLERVLKAASMWDKTVVVTTSNAAWSAPGSIMDLFLESFRVGNGTQWVLNHLVIVAFDPKAYAWCKTVHRHCFALVTDGVDFSEQKYFMSEGYLQLVWRKLDVLRMILAKGYNFVFTDADIMWFQNPFPYFYPDTDFQTSCDRYMSDPDDINNMPNTGFKYVKSNERTIAFYNYWYSSREKLPGNTQQGVFNTIKFNPYLKEIGIKIKFLSTDIFGGLCTPLRDLKNICTIHVTCCVGLENKAHDLRVLRDDWKKYISIPEKKRERQPYTWSYLQLLCS